MTSQLQPPDVSINIPYKHLLCKHYDAWRHKDNHILTTSGTIKRASALIIVKWTAKAWKEVPVNITSKSFLKCCLSNEEDYILWDGSEQNGEAASPSEKESATEQTSRLNKNRKECACSKNFKFPFILVYFPLLFTLNVF
jgi:hypothetical protein